MPVFISSQREEFKRYEEPLKEFAQKLLSAIGREDLELSVTLVDDETIRELNRRWRNKDRPTDVLSFPQDFPPRDFSPSLSSEGVIDEALLWC